MSNTKVATKGSAAADKQSARPSDQGSHASDWMSRRFRINCSLHRAELVATYNSNRQQLQAMATKAGDLERDADEHK